MVNIRKRFLRRDVARIFYVKHDICPASFTHELLHILMKSKKILIANDLDNGLGKRPEIDFLFSYKLKIHIGNCLEHIKTLPIFLELGYPAEKFISDYDEEKMNDQLVEEIRNHYTQNKILNRQAVDFYIAKFFAMKACNNYSYDYSSYYNSLKKIDFELYRLLDAFWNSWIGYDISKGREYKKILTQFFTWKKGKSFFN